MNETGIIQYVRELYEEGCIVRLYVDKNNIKLIDTQNANISEN